MITTATLANILFWYDRPQVILAKDMIGTQYIGVLGQDSSQYTCVTITPMHLTSFLSGDIDLLSLYMHAAPTELFTTEIVDFDVPFPLIPTSFEIIANDLPNAGFCIKPSSIK